MASERPNIYSLFTQYHDAIDCLNDEQYGRIMRAINKYIIDGEEPQIADDDLITKMFWGGSFVNLQKSREISLKRRAASNQRSTFGGGAPRGNSNAKRAAVTANQDDSEEENNSKTTTKQQQNNNKTTTKIEDRNKKKEDSIKSKSERIFDQNSLLEEGKRIDELYEMGQWSKYCDFVMSFWNDAMKGKQCPCIAKMPTKRKQLIRLLLDKGHTGLEILKAITNTAESPYLNGAGEDGFVASFDWVLSPTNFTKVVDNDYREWK